MTQEGQPVPVVTFRAREGGAWRDLTSEELFTGKRAKIVKSFTKTATRADMERAMGVLSGSGGSRVLSREAAAAARNRAARESSSEFLSMLDADDAWTPDYLEKINKGYFDFIKSYPEQKTLILDVSSIDFVHSAEDYHYVLDRILDFTSGVQQP